MVTFLALMSLAGAGIAVAIFIGMMMIRAADRKARYSRSKRGAARLRSRDRTRQDP